MGNTHINQNLDPDQRIFQYMDFHDLVDLLKFNQAYFACADRRQRQSLQNAPGRWHYLAPSIPPAHKGKSKTRLNNKPIGNKPMHELDIDAISLQWWTQADDGSSTPWDDNNNQQARVCLVSSIRALSQSLFTDESTHVFIERAGDCGVARALASSGSDRYRRSPALPAINPDDLCAIAISKRTDSSSGLSPAGTHLRVDLSTLLTGVMVPHYATQRYKELVTKLVQESVWVTVTRASPPEASSNVFRLADNGTPKLSAAPRLNRLAPIAALPPQITHLRQP